MATRQQIQVAQDIIKYANIINDFADCLSGYLKGIDINTGKPWVIGIETGTREPTVNDIKAQVSLLVSHIGMYKSKLDAFFAANPILSSESLFALGININDVKADVASTSTVMNTVISLANVAVTKESLALVAKQIDDNIPKLNLLRRA